MAGEAKSLASWMDARALEATSEAELTRVAPFRQTVTLDEGGICYYGQEIS